MTMINYRVEKILNDGYQSIKFNYFFIDSFMRHINFYSLVFPVFLGGVHKMRNVKMKKRKEYN